MIYLWLNGNPVYFEVHLEKMPDAPRDWVNLNAQPTKVGGTNPPYYYSVLGPTGTTDNPLYMVRIGGEPVIDYKFYESQMGYPQTINIGGVPFRVRLYRKEGRLVIEFQQSGLASSAVATNVGSPSAQSSVAGGNTSNTAPQAQTVTPSVGDPCSAGTAGPGAAQSAAQQTTASSPPQAIR